MNRILLTCSLTFISGLSVESFGHGPEVPKNPTSDGYEGRKNSPAPLAAKTPAVSSSDGIYIGYKSRKPLTATLKSSFPLDKTFKSSGNDQLLAKSLQELFHSLEEYGGMFNGMKITNLRAKTVTKNGHTKTLLYFNGTRGPDKESATYIIDPYDALSSRYYHIPHSLPKSGQGFPPDPVELYPDPTEYVDAGQNYPFKRLNSGRLTVNSISEHLTSFVRAHPQTGVIHDGEVVTQMGLEAQNRDSFSSETNNTNFYQEFMLTMPKSQKKK